MPFEGGAEEPDAFERFQEFFDDLGDTSMGASEPPQSSEKGPSAPNWRTGEILTPIALSTSLNFLRRRVKSRTP